LLAIWKQRGSFLRSHRCTPTGNRFGFIGWSIRFHGSSGTVCAKCPVQTLILQWPINCTFLHL